MHFERMFGAVALGAALAAAPALAQTYTKTQLQETYTQYLSAEGYRPELTTAGNVRFRREGKNYVIFVEEKDPTYFRLGTALSYDDKSPEARAARLDGASFASEQTKVIKAYVSKEGDVTFTAEMFLVVPGDFKNAFARTLRAMDYAVDKYRTRMTELGKQP